MIKIKNYLKLLVIPLLLLVGGCNNQFSKFETFVAPNKTFSIQTPKDWAVSEFHEVGGTSFFFSPNKIELDAVLKGETIILEAMFKVMIRDIKYQRRKLEFKEFMNVYLEDKYRYLKKTYKDLNMVSKGIQDDYILNGLKGMRTHDYHIEDNDNDITFYTRQGNKLIEINYTYLDTTKEKVMPTLEKMLSSVKLLSPAILKTELYQNQSKTFQINLPEKWHTIEAHKKGINYFSISKNYVPREEFNFEKIKTGVMIIEIENIEKHQELKPYNYAAILNRANHSVNSINQPHLIFGIKTNKKQVATSYERGLQFKSGYISHEIIYFRAANGSYYEVLLKSEESLFDLYKPTFEAALNTLKLSRASNE
ncbi:hypothetical protein HOH87_05400 [bacterium]|nr:hypothetical protein [bacterium]